MVRRKKAVEPTELDAASGGEGVTGAEDNFIEEDAVEEEAVPEDEIICKLTQERRKVTPEEEIIQALVDQLHREYRVEMADMARDLPFRISQFDESAGKSKAVTRRAALVVYDKRIPPEERTKNNIIRAVMVAKKGTRPEDKKQGVKALDDLLFYLAEDRANANIYGAWKNGDRLSFRMLRQNPKSGFLEAEDLTDFPAPDETLEDLEDANRLPLRIATKESLLRAFKSAHDYLYGNQSMRGDRAFWQLLNLIFCKILDEQQSLRLFFVARRRAILKRGGSG